MSPPMAQPKIVVTRRIPEPAVELLEEAGDVWVSPDDRPLEVSELHDAVAGADVVVTLLHDKVDDAFFDAAGDQLRRCATWRSASTTSTSRRRRSAASSSRTRPQC